ncbi:UDP-glycosyltransferase 73C6-like isoform X2 [Lolium rigidum]|uniref:UDP-glycosyltransferase 73C6-like isoform X2 n=1 Tax=Lolium rigidum TaxID=89674 RepID=UPI001F5D2875|nr:UDP-glycosyltransferase 73C6-like isoform X2 [Lolium rigidum]
MTEESSAKRAHFVFIPLMAQGHIIPAIDTALLLCARGALCSIVATPATAARVRPCIEQSGLEVRLLEFPLEYVSDGADNMDNISAERVVGYFQAVALLQAPVEEHLRTHAPRATCIVSDFCHPWTSALAASLGVPRLSFLAIPALSALCELEADQVDEPVMVPVPGWKKRVQLTRDHTARFFSEPCWRAVREEIYGAQAEVDGMILTTFLELEPEYVRGFAAASGKQVWTVGPVSLHHQLTGAGGGLVKTARGDAATVDADEYLRWLDGKEGGSVVYVSFGTLAPTMEPEQLLELGLGLEASGYPFIWVFNKADHLGEPLRQLQARVAGHGRIVTGWVPQLLILSHAALGCFLTHCGWNSIMETIMAAKPVVTWPRLLDSDQPVNEKLVVDELGIGLSIRPKEPDMAVRREVIQAALTTVLCGGEEGQEMRRRVRELSLKATQAMQPGGSSHTNLCDLVNRFTI